MITQFYIALHDHVASCCAIKISIFLLLDSVLFLGASKKISSCGVVRASATPLTKTKTTKMASCTVLLQEPREHPHFGQLTCTRVQRNRLWTSSRDSTIRLWSETPSASSNSNSNSSMMYKHEKTLIGHCGEVSDIQVLWDYERLLSVSSDKTMRMWDTRRGKCLHVAERFPDYAEKVSITRACDRAVAVGLSGGIMTWDIPEFRMQTMDLVSKNYGSLYACDIDDFGHRIIVGGSNGIVYLLDLRQHGGRSTQQTVWSVNGTVRAVKLSGDGTYALMGSSDGQVSLYDIRILKQNLATYNLREHAISEHRRNVNSLFKFLSLSVCACVFVCVFSVSV